MKADELAYNSSVSPMKQAMRQSKKSEDLNGNNNNAFETQSNETKYFNKSNNQFIGEDDGKGNLLNSLSRGENEINTRDLSESSPIH